MPIRTMTPEEAQWIRENALTPRIIATRGSLNRCACQYGTCGNCADGIRHDRCAKRNSRPPTEMWAATITDRRGFVAVGRDADGWVSPHVYEVGHRHAWICPCHRTGHAGWVEAQQALAAEEAARPVQLELF